MPTKTKPAANAVEAGPLAEAFYGAGILPGEAGMFTAVLPIKAGALSDAAKTVLVEQCISAEILAPAGWISPTGSYYPTKPRGSAGFAPVFAAPGVTLPAGDTTTSYGSQADGATPATGTRTRGRRVTAKTGT